MQYLIIFSSLLIAAIALNNCRIDLDELRPTPTPAATRIYTNKQIITPTAEWASFF